MAINLTINTAIPDSDKSKLSALLATLDDYSFAVDHIVNQTSDTLTSDANYAANNTGFYNALFDFLQMSEGLKTLRYIDGAGLSSIGIGFNMDQWGTGQSQLETYLQPILEAIGVNDWAAVYNGGESISVAQAKELFHITMTGRTSDGVVAVDNWGDVTAVKLYNQLKASPNAVSNGEVIAGTELATLFSLAFNNPSLIGQNLRSYVENDNLSSAIEEILEHSNNMDIGDAGIHGIANRRLVEAAVYKNDANLTQTDAEFWDIVDWAQKRWG